MARRVAISVSYVPRERASGLYGKIGDCEKSTHDQSDLICTQFIYSYCCPVTDSRGVAINVFLVIVLSERMMNLFRIILVSCR